MKRPGPTGVWLSGSTVNPLQALRRQTLAVPRVTFAAMKITLTIRWALLPLVLALVACGGGGGGGSLPGASAQPEAGNQAEAGDQAETSPAAVTWYSAASPLIARYCVACHSVGGVAPFPLETYDQVYSKRSALVYVLESQTMPPPGYAHPAPTENQLLLQWLNAGAPRGDASQAPLQQLAQGLSYHADARAIIEEKCVSCHEDGGIAPFPLDSYDRVKAVSAAAAFAIDNGTMPPWHPTQGYTSFADSRALTPQQKHIVLNWLRGDMAEGNPGDYLAPPESAAKDSGDYNLQLVLPQPYTPTLRPDDHRCFAIEWPLDEFAYITSLDVVPDQLEQVHHVIVSVVEPEDAALVYAAGGQDGSPGWYCLGMGGVEGVPLPRQIGAWVPGVGRDPLPANTGIGVEPGSVVIVQMHYNTLVAEPRPDQSTILVETAAEVLRPASSFLVTDPRWLAPGGMPIAAGDPDAHHEVTIPTNILAAIRGQFAGVRVNEPWVLHNGFVHMHTRGKSGRITLQRKNGTEQVLLDIRDWDFNWQSTYRFARELLLKPGDRVRLECNWDNTASNQDIVNGVPQTPRYIEWGDGTGDEMCLLAVLMTRPQNGYDYSYAPTVHIESPHYRQQFVAGDLVPLKLLLNNFTLQDPGLHDHGDPAEHGGSDHLADSADHSQVFSGHYHVYLDTDDDDAPHLTAWDDSYYYQLPDNITPGVHALRVSLRGGDHHPLGIEQSVEIEVVASPASASSSLVEVANWVTLDAAEDSLADHRPATLECPDNSWYAEDGALEVETGYCNYLSLGQPSVTELRTGDKLHLVLWHADLAFEEAASAHVAVSIAGKLVWEAQVAIPTGANIYDVLVPVDFDAPAGSAVEFHLHNHGYNSWTLLKLERRR
jgi:mono/diheme cytochrome c family protein